MGGAVTSCRKCVGYFQDECIPPVRSDRMVAVDAHHGSGTAWLCTDSVHGEKVGWEVEKVTYQNYCEVISSYERAAG